MVINKDSKGISYEAMSKSADLNSFFKEKNEDEEEEE